jgi:long-chain acyl-CoA synthetase
MNMARFWHKSWPEALPHDIEISNTTINDTLIDTAQRFPNNIAFELMGKKLTFNEVDELSNQFAHGLKDLGIKQGDCIGIMLPNLTQFPIAFFGALKAGAIVSPVNPLLKEFELKHQLTSSEAKCLIALDAFTDTVEKGRIDTPVETIIYTRTGEYMPKAKAFLGKLVRKIPAPRLPVDSSIHMFQDILSGKLVTPPRCETTPDDIATLLYTGGTTGLPKGAMLTHRNLMFNAHAGRRWFDVDMGEECFIGILPFFHAFGLSCVLVLSAVIASSIILVPRPDLKEILHLIAKHHVTVLVGVPTLYVGLLNSPDLKPDALRSLKHAFSGAAPLPVEILEEFKKITGVHIVEGYGMTETSPILTLIPEGTMRPGSVGLPIFNTDIKIVDSADDAKKMPVGEWGEILARGPQIMKGYFRRKDESEAALKDGWMHTGDIGRFDEEGYVWIGDRKKDLIKYKGYSVFPAEVEDLLYRHPAVEECGVVGIPDPVAGESIKAFIMLKPDYEGKVTEDDIREWAKENMAAYKYPRHIAFVSQLPKSLVGKILRRELRKEDI